MAQETTKHETVAKDQENREATTVDAFDEASNAGDCDIAPLSIYHPALRRGFFHDVEDEEPLYWVL